MMLSLDFHATKIMFKYLYMIGIAKEMATVGNAKNGGEGERVPLGQAGRTKSVGLRSAGVLCGVQYGVWRPGSW
jgi:hypothetical protein